MSGKTGNRKRGEHAGGWTVAAVVALLSTGLAFGMDVLGVLAAFDEAVLSLLAGLGGVDGLLDFPAGVSWVILAVVCFGLAFAMIEAPGGWRRLVLWVSCGAVIAAAIPLAALAARWVTPGGPMVAWLWTGICGMIYAHRHDPTPVLRPPSSVEIVPAGGARGGVKDRWNEGDSGPGAG